MPDGGEGSVRLGRVGADHFVVAADRDRRQALGARGRQGLGGRLHLGLGGFQVGALLFGLGHGGIHALHRRRAEGKAVGELIIGIGRQPGEARQIDLLLGEIVAQRNDLLLLGERAHLVLIHVELRQHALCVLFGGLMEHGIGGVELGLRGIHAGLRGQRLQISAAHGQGDQVARILQAVLAGARGGLGGAVVIDRGQVRHRLAETGLQREVVERAHDGGNTEAGHAEAQSEAPPDRPAPRFR